MTDLKQDAHLLLHLNEVFFPSLDARKWVYSEALENVVKAGTFFDTYALDSDERFYVNEIANYFEKLGMFWKKGIVDSALVLEWQSAGLYWQKIGPILVQSREIFGIGNLWEDFEALAKEGMA
jgi:hypothetical protein